MSFKIPAYLQNAYRNIINSIGFYPTALAILFLALAWFCLHVDTIEFGKGITDFFSFLVVKDTETARSILSLFAGGLISLMVFSFSMVMIVLNQTASSYSPRVLPGLVSRREHQIVLGIYLGTIVYTIAVLSNIHTETYDELVPQFSILVNFILAFGCFGAFVYFIHDISNIIQVGNIVKRLYKQTEYSLLKEFSEGLYTTEKIAFSQNYRVEAWQSGYFYGVVEGSFLEQKLNKPLQARLLVNQGQYILKGEPFLEINQPAEEEVVEKIKDRFIFRHQELIKENFYYGFKQITEIAVKALSPGINDPGTALQTIDYLSDLFVMLVKIEGHKVLRLKDGTPTLVYLTLPYEEIFYFSVSSIRNYATDDLVVLVKLVQLIKKIAHSDVREEFQKLYQSELNTILEIVENSIKNKKDVEYMKRLINGGVKEE